MAAKHCRSSDSLIPINRSTRRNHGEEPGAGGGRHRVHRPADRAGEPGGGSPDAGPHAAGDRPGHRQAPDAALLQGAGRAAGGGVAGGPRGARRRRGAGRRGDLGLGHVRGAPPQPQPLLAASARRGYQGGWERQGPSLNLHALSVQYSLYSKNCKSLESQTFLSLTKFIL